MKLHLFILFSIVLTNSLAAKVRGQKQHGSAKEKPEVYLHPWHSMAETIFFYCCVVHRSGFITV